jgi:hypothetical protein
MVPTVRSREVYFCVGTSDAAAAEEEEAVAAVDEVDWRRVRRECGEKCEGSALLLNVDAVLDV